MVEEEEEEEEEEEVVVVVVVGKGEDGTSNGANPVEEAQNKLAYR